MLTEKLQRYLDSNHVRYDALHHSRAYTSQGVAATLHVSGHELAKTVVLRVGEGFALAVVPGPSWVDIRRFQEAAGVEHVRLASESEFQSLFPGCELGAEPPFGNLYGLPVWVDESLARQPEIVFNAGRHDEAVRMTYADFARLVAPRVAHIARP